MRVLYITYDGIMDPVSRSQALPYIEGLSKAGNSFTLLSFEKREKKLYDDRLKRSGVKWIPLRYHKKPVIPATALDVLAGVVKGLRLIRSDNIEAVHARGYVPMLIASILKKISKVKIIFDMRGFWADEKVDAGAWKKDGALYRIVKKMESVFLAYADQIIVLTDTAKRYLLEKAPAKAPITVIPCCVDPELFKRPAGETAPPSGDIPDNFKILYAGSLGSFYNLDKILDFFIFMKMKNSSAFLRIVSGYPKESLDAACAACNIKNTWYSLESLDYRDMPAAFCESDLSVIFYNRPLSGKGCSPIKLSESLACGTPVVINSGIGDCDNIVESNNVGVVIKDFSQEEYTRAYEKMRELMSQKESTALRCAEVAKKIFSLASGVKAYQNIYERLAG